MVPGYTISDYLRITTATMYNFANPGETSKRMPKADDIAGICGGQGSDVLPAPGSEHRLLDWNRQSAHPADRSRATRHCTDRFQAPPPLLRFHRDRL
jgi:hypothetical protein